MPPSPYTVLDELLIPADDGLRLIIDLFSFDFITELLGKTYCYDNGGWPDVQILFLEGLFEPVRC